MKKKIISLIDGFNLYHAIHDIPDCRQYKWLNLRKLTECFMQRNEELVEVTYFSAYATWIPDKVVRHRLYVDALRSVGVKTVLSEFRLVDIVQSAKRCIKHTKRSELMCK